MSYKLNDFGTSAVNDLTISDGATDKINSYARVVELGENTVTLDAESILEGDFEKFTAGTEILFHVSAAPVNSEKLGRYKICKVLLVREDVLTLDCDLREILSNDELAEYYAQVVTLANFDCLRLKEGGILTPPTYNPFKFRGGILALKIRDTLYFEGGHISLSDCGIPVNRKNILRPLTEQETDAQGILDSAPLAGKENSITPERFLLNSGDGAAFIAANKIICDTRSRIGNIKTHGTAHSRGAADSPVKPSNITNVGGSSILIVSREIKNFSPLMIAKYRQKTDSESDTGRGLARCYIAAENILPFDDALYTFDYLSDETRLSLKKNVTSYGNAKFGNVENPAYSLTNAADVIHAHGQKLHYKNKSVKARAPLKTGAKVFIQAENDFCLADVLLDDGEFIHLDFAPPANPVKIYSVAQFESLTINAKYNHFVAACATEFIDIRGAVLRGAFLCAKRIILDELTRFELPSVLVADSIQGLTEGNFALPSAVYSGLDR